MTKHYPALLAHLLNIPRQNIMPWDKFELTEEQQEQLCEWQQRLDQGEPLSKIIGEREFWSRSFKVTVDTLDPRPDTETLIEACLKYHQELPQPINILELGVGTGCLIITLLLEFNKLVQKSANEAQDSAIEKSLNVDLSHKALDVAKENAKRCGTEEKEYDWRQSKSLGVDLSQKALNVAKENAKRHGIEEKECDWKISNWFDRVGAQKFSLIISNPPYIQDDYPLDDNVLSYDPHLALYGGKDGLNAYKTIANSARLYMKKDGLFICEIGIGQKQPVTEIFEAKGFHLRHVFKDLSGIDRCLVFA